MGFFGPSEEDKKAIIKSLRSEVVELESEVKGLKKEIEQNEEYYEDRDEAREKAQTKRSAEIEEDLRVTKRKLAIEQSEAIADAKREATADVDTIERNADKRVRDAEAKVENTAVAVQKAELALTTKHLKEVTDLKVEVATETAQREAAEEMIVSLQKQLTSMTALMTGFAETNQEFADSLIEKLPTVDLSKFNIEVNVPAPVVQQQNKGGDQKQK